VLTRPWIHSDDASRSLYLELEIGIARDGHELDVTWPPQDSTVGSREVNHLEGEHLYVAVACISESDMQTDLPEWDGLFTWDHYVERVWVGLEKILVQP
jgi:hypothetical protein